LLEKFNELSATLNSNEESCQLCGSKFSNETLSKHEQEKEAIKNKLMALKSNIDKFDAICLNESNFKVKLNELRITKKNEENRALNSKIRINDIKSKLTVQQLNKKSLLEKLQKQDQVLTKITEIEKLISLTETKMSSLEADITLYKTVASLSSPTGIQAYVIDSIIDSLNQYISENISMLWPNMSYTISTHRENSKGDLVAKLSDSLSINGKMSSLGSLSGGEYKALSLCVDFAIVSLIEKQFGIRLNPIMLDEPFDGLDTVGRELVLELLNKMSSDRSIIVIDHASESKSMFSNVILISKRNGISTISVSA
jgi:DNA repair exonuclease SbcCD ATPase subunit